MINSGMNLELETWVPLKKSDKEFEDIKANKKNIIYQLIKSSLISLGTVINKYWRSKRGVSGP